MLVPLLLTPALPVAHSPPSSSQGPQQLEREQLALSPNLWGNSEWISLHFSPYFLALLTTNKSYASHMSTASSTRPGSSSSSEDGDNKSSAPSSLSPSSSGPSSPKDKPATVKAEVEGYALPVSQRSKEEYASYKIPAVHESYPPMPKEKILDKPSTVGVPDDWILRDERLIHLTGKVSLSSCTIFTEPRRSLRCRV